jgi:hypothetical protein
MFSLKLSHLYAVQRNKNKKYEYNLKVLCYIKLHKEAS